jgi:hypothetical protein
MASEIVKYAGMSITVPQSVTVAPHVAGALALCFAHHPKEQLPPESILMYHAQLEHLDAEMLKVAAMEFLSRSTWFPKPNEIARTARFIDTLITSKGMYLKDDASRKRIAEIRCFERDMRPATVEFIQRRREMKHR